MSYELVLCLMSYEENNLNKYLRHYTGLPDDEDNKADVILKYNADEGINLKACGKLPKYAEINETDTFGTGDDDEIQFDDTKNDDKDHDDI
ncbi:eukaryotic translation initiation factor 1a [Lynx pardinus]|uniref:Eukaryotic translation initiation factor 1a n=1 Tax=Lynx pardinus TaxID=191816 RepID=A0A485N8T2_LYNPA|nr:eukaryotic translation initiation factor 1a [Lynx pardinus]